VKTSKAETTALTRATYVKPLSRADVTEMIVAMKIKKKMKWETVAKKMGLSKEWTTTALLGQMQMTKKHAEIAGKLFDLPEEAVDLLQVVPMKASFPGGVPTDPLIYRLYEMVLIYGTTIKELIHEEFGDGIMSAIDFDMDLTRLPNEKGDRVKLVLTGKYLQYKTY
jgi:cyanate lyase